MKSQDSVSKTSDSGLGDSPGLTFTMTDFGRALRINQNNAAVKVDMEKALQKLRSSGNADALMRSWKGRLGLTEHEIDCLVEAGAKPWDENVQVRITTTRRTVRSAGRLLSSYWRNRIYSRSVD